MNLDAFLHNLHFDIDKVRPLDLEVNWLDAPLTYKLYRDLPVIPLSPDIPLTLEGREAPCKPDLIDIGSLLWYVYGLSQYCQSVTASETEGESVGVMHSIRRFVPSGGALYPNELYVYLKLEDLASGIYHYDVAHHRLVLLRAGNFDAYLMHALGQRCDVSACFAIVFVSTFFWKNFFKYHNFAYRLQGLDAGVLIGQLLEVAKRYRFASGVYFQFLDRAVNHLLGLSQQEESVYAMIALSTEPATNWFRTVDTLDTRGRNSNKKSNENSDENENQSIHAIKSVNENKCVYEQPTSFDLCKELPELHHTRYIRSKKVLEYQMLTQMNEASMLETFVSWHLSQIFRITTEIETGQNAEQNKDQNGFEGWADPFCQSCQSDHKDQMVVIPKVKRLSYDLAEICRKRYSPGIDFQLDNVSQTQLATLLQEATASFVYHNDLDQIGPHANAKRFSNPRVFLYCCLNHVDGIADGAYRYDMQTHMLHAVNLGDHRLRLQEGMTMHNVNLSQVPICLHVVGETEHYMSELGYRGYRIQQMEVGMLVQRLVLAATALGMGGHPLLGYEASICDEIYKLNSREQTCLIQIPVGPYRYPPRLEGSLQF